MKKVVYPGLVAEMARRGDTLATIGKLIGVSATSVSRRMLGKQEWSIGEVDKLCEYYNKNYYQLFKDEQE